MDSGKAADALGDTPAIDMDDTTSVIMDFANTGESLPPRRGRRASAGRRVSFADTAKVHVFERDDEYETPPEAQAEDTTKTATVGKRRSPRLADKHKRKESLDEARVALAPRFDVATPSAGAGGSTFNTTDEWILQRENPELDSPDIDMDETGPIDVRRLRNEDLTEDDVTADAPLFADLLKEDGTATCGATLMCDQLQFAGEEGMPLTYTANEYPMSMTYTPSKWPIELPHYTMEDSQDSDMSLCSDFPMKEMLQATAEADSSRRRSLVEVPVVSSQEYDKEMCREATDMDLVATTDFVQLPFEQGKKAAKRRLDSKPSVGPDESSATKKGRASLLKSQRLILSSSTGAGKVDKENLPPEHLVPARPANKKGDVAKARSGLSLKERPDNPNVPELLTADTQDLTTDRAGLSLKEIPDNRNVPELLTADTQDLTTDRADITMAIPRLSDLLSADGADSDVSSPGDRLSERQQSKDSQHDEDATVSDEIKHRDPDQRCEIEDNALEPQMVKIVRMLHMLKEPKSVKDQAQSGTSDIASMQFTEVPKSLAESLRFSYISKPQMQDLDARLGRYKQALADLTSKNAKMSVPDLPAGSLHMEATSCKQLEGDVLKLKGVALKYVTKELDERDKGMQIMEENKRVLEKEVHILRDARESQQEVLSLANDLRSTIASTAAKVKGKARSVSRTDDLIAKTAQVLQQVQLQETTLKSRESLWAQLKHKRKIVEEKLEQARRELSSLSAKDANLIEKVRLQKEKQEMLQKVQRLRLRTYIPEDQQRQVLEVTYFNLFCQRFFSEDKEPLVMCSSFFYLPEDMNKVFPQLNACKLFFSALPPFENVVLGPAKLIPGTIQEIERRAWKVVKLMEELQECKYNFLFYLQAPKINGNDGDLEVSMKFAELRKGLRFRVRIKLDAESWSVSGDCEVQVDYLSRETRKHLSAETIIDTVKAVQPGCWRIRRICEAVQDLINDLRKKP